MPPNWLAYPPVAAVDAAVRAAERLGGRVLLPATDVAIGRVAVVADPLGTAFGIFDGDTDP